MNHLTYEELYVGQSAAFTREVTAEMMQQFRAVSGDNNPLHVSSDFARDQGFSDRVVYGMLTASLYSCLAGEHLPGERCLLQSVHSDFLHPVFIGNTLRVEGKITEKNDSVRQIIVKAVIRNQDGKKVSKARIEAGVL